MAVAGLRWPPKQATRKCRLFCLGARQDALARWVRCRGWPRDPEAARIGLLPLPATLLAADVWTLRPCLDFFARAGPASLTTRRRCPGVSLEATPAFQPLS